MSDPRNVAHDKRVSQEKKHHGSAVVPEQTAVTQPGRKSAAKAKHGAAVADPVPNEAAVGEAVVSTGTPTPKPSAALDSSLTVLAKLKDMEFHSRATLERLAELQLTVADELKQKELTAPLADVYSAQNALQTKLTGLIETYKAECDRLQGTSSNF